MNQDEMEAHSTLSKKVIKSLCEDDSRCEFAMVKQMKAKFGPHTIDKHKKMSGLSA